MLVKPVAGGGGKGIRVVGAEADLGPSLAAARREAVRAFGDPRLLIERHVREARHVEVQVLGDRHGSLSTSATVTARCSVVTRSSWRRRRHPGCGATCGRRCGRRRSGSQAPWAT